MLGVSALWLISMIGLMTSYRPAGGELLNRAKAFLWNCTYMRTAWPAAHASIITKHIVVLQPQVRSDSTCAKMLTRTATGGIVALYLDSDNLSCDRGYAKDAQSTKVLVLAHEILHALRLPDHHFHPAGPEDFEKYLAVDPIEKTIRECALEPGAIAGFIQEAPSARN